MLASTRLASTRSSPPPRSLWEDKSLCASVLQRLGLVITGHRETESQNLGQANQSRNLFKIVFFQNVFIFRLWHRFQNGHELLKRVMEYISK